jgi:hypothetical protein
LEDALSCDVPLFVWNVKSMNQEYGYHYEDHTATVIPYWSETCGEYFYNVEEMEHKFDIFLSKLEQYEPRKYIVENLSMQKCEERFIELIHSIPTRDVISDVTEDV